MYMKVLYGMSPLKNRSRNAGFFGFLRLNSTLIALVLYLYRKRGLLQNWGTRSPRAVRTVQLNSSRSSRRASSTSPLNMCSANRRVALPRTGWWPVMACGADFSYSMHCFLKCFFFLVNSYMKRDVVKKLPLSGSEPTCTRAPYSLKSTVPRNNCYSYAVQHLSRTGTPKKLQPGNLSGLEGVNFNLQTCHPAFTRVMKDLVATKRGYMTAMETPCRTGFGKIALMLSRGNDFHFIRQNGDVVYPVEAGETLQSIARKFRVPRANVTPLGTTMKKVRVVGAGVWSHKRGTAYPPTLYDAKGQVIFDPRKANFDYGYLNYNRYCSSFCVKQKPCSRKK